MKTAGTGSIRAVGRYVLVSVFLCFFLVSSTMPVCAATDPYEPKQAGHPLKIVAYFAFPLGVLVDYALMRPAYFIVQHEPFATIFGYNIMTEDEAEAYVEPAKERLGWQELQSQE